MNIETFNVSKPQNSKTCQRTLFIFLLLFYSYCAFGVLSLCCNKNLNPTHLDAFRLFRCENINIKCNAMQCKVQSQSNAKIILKFSKFSFDIYVSPDDIVQYFPEKNSTRLDTPYTVISLENIFKHRIDKR